MIFAEAAIDPGVPMPTTIVGAFIAVSLALVGLVGWILRHVFLTTIPSITATYLETLRTTTASHEGRHDALLGEQKSMRAAHDKNLTDVLKAAHDEAGIERKQCADQFGAINSGLVALVATHQQECKAIIAAINQHTSEAMAAYRHDLTDRLQEAVYGRELYMLRKADEERMKAEQKGKIA